MGSIIAFLRMFIFALLGIYEYLFIARAIVSWFPMIHGNPIVELLYTITEPILAPIRAVLWKIPGFDSLPLDFSLLVAYLLIEVLRRII